MHLRVGFSNLRTLTAAQILIKSDCNMINNFTNGAFATRNFSTDNSSGPDNSKTDDLNAIPKKRKPRTPKSVDVSEAKTETQPASEIKEAPKRKRTTTKKEE